MADLVILPQDVIGSTAQAQQGVAGVDLSAGMPIWLDAAAASAVKPGNASDIKSAKCVGVTLTGAFAGQPILYQKSGTMKVSPVLNPGHYYIISLNDGKIAPVGDLAPGMYSSLIGYATAVDTLMILPTATGQLTS